MTGRLYILGGHPLDRGINLRQILVGTVEEHRTLQHSDIGNVVGVYVWVLRSVRKSGKHQILKREVIRDIILTHLLVRGRDVITAS